MDIYTKIYRKYLVIEKGVKVLQVRLQKSVDGFLHRALLFDLKPTIDLKNNGFSQNPYNPCVANKLVNGK